jgi:phosphonopyruvate decarboxylase
MKGYEVISALENFLSKDDIIVSSNGNISREAYHLLPKPQIYLRGSMGLPVSVGLGLAISNPSKRVIVITGDGNFLMGLGTNITASYYHPKNLKILILDNSKYFTTGGQKTVSPALDFNHFLQSINCAFHSSKKADSVTIEHDLSELLHSDSFGILHLMIESAKKDLANIPWHPEQITKEFQKRFS